MWSAMSDGAEYLDTIKHLNIDDAAQALSRLKGISIDDALRFLSGKDFANAAQLQMLKDLGGVAGGKAPLKNAAARMAGSKLTKNALRVVPGLTAAFAVGDVADVVTNDTSWANKAMDATAMGIGGVIGSVGGPVGAMAGASTGKMISDGTQWLFGDKKTPEQRRMEEALRALQQGGLI